MLLFLPLVIPFATAILAMLAWRSPGVQKLLSLAGALLLLATALVILARVLSDGPFAEQAGNWPAPFGITMVADMLSAVMVALAAIVATAIALFALADIDADEIRHGYHPLANALLAGICGAFLTGDLFNMYVWFEVMLISSFGLLVIGGGKAQIDGAFKYATLNLIGTVAFITGVGLLYGTTGALNMADLRFRLEGRGDDAAVLAACAFLVFAFGAKAALVPVFFWLPAAYHTPSFTTSALFAALLTKVGVYALVRTFTLILPLEGTPIGPVLLWAGALTMLVGALGALVQTGARTTLNFTILSSVGAMILGLAIGTPLALLGAVYYLFQDVIVKTALFLGVGAAARLTGSETYARTGGLWRIRGWFTVLLLLPTLSLSGIPPFPGFWGKLILLKATLATNPLLTTLVLATGFLTLFAMARMWAELVWKSHPDGDQAIDDRLPAAMWVPLVALVALITLAGLVAEPLIEAAQAAASGLIDPAAYVAAVLGDPS